MIESVWRMLILMHGQACSGWPAGQAAASRPTPPPMSLPGTPSSAVTTRPLRNATGGRRQLGAVTLR
jgi:hypothetical protein